MALKKCMDHYSETKSNYWIHHATEILEIILNSYTKASSLARISKSIAEDALFIDKI
jgi:hypothetical protein